MKKLELQDLLTSSGKYPERAKDPSLTMGILKNGNILLDKVNALLEEMDVESIIVNSGFRTAASNAATPNASKKSNHLTLCAIDLHDPEQKLGKKIKLDYEITKDQSVLVKYGLYMEDLSATPTWCHLQFVVTKSGKHIFMP
jgi:hypothetical protein